MAKEKTKILIVEDHPLNLKLFRDILHARGFDTIEDRVGNKCLEYATLYQPALIILDVLLPHSSGIELAHALKAQDSTRHIPLLGVTALAISDTHTKMLQAGCGACLTKPFTLDQFLRGIQDVLKKAGTPIHDLDLAQKGGLDIHPAPHPVDDMKIAQLI
jgi:two-component system cell cycle response regulator DivK